VCVAARWTHCAEAGTFNIPVRGLLSEHAAVVVSGRRLGNMNVVSVLRETLPGDAVEAECNHPETQGAQTEQDERQRPSARAQAPIAATLPGKGVVQGCQPLSPPHICIRTAGAAAAQAHDSPSARAALPSRLPRPPPTPTTPQQPPSQSPGSRPGSATPSRLPRPQTPRAAGRSPALPDASPRWHRQSVRLQAMTSSGVPRPSSAKAAFRPDFQVRQSLTHP
jgi:hypothetical protein